MATINHIAELWWHWTAGMLWQVGILIVAVGIADWLLKRWAWPQLRYALWLLVLIKLVLPTDLGSPLSVTNGISELPRRVQIVAPADKKSNLTSNIDSQNSGPQRSLAVAETNHQTIAPNVNPQVENNNSSVNSSPWEQKSANTSADTKTQVTGPMPVNWRVYAMGVWIFGVWVLAGWLIVRVRNLAKLTKISESSRKPDGFDELLSQCAKRVGLKRLPKVVFSRSVRSPAVFGALRPTLLMPADSIATLRREDTEHILLHELAHIRRGDLIVHAIYMILQIVYWYNPLLWWVRRQLQHLRELCCDATVARLLRENTKKYRDTLLEAARALLAEKTEPGLGLLGLFEDANRLRTRLNWLEKKTWRHRPLRIATVFVVTALMLACVLPMATVKAKTENKTTQIDVTTPTAEKSSDQFIATLSNGVTVELVGVCEYPSAGKPWWRPDGSPLGFNIETKDFSNYTDKNKGYEIAYKVQRPDDVNIGFLKIRGATQQSQLTVVKPTIIEVLRAHISVWGNTTSVGFPIAYGPWKTLGQTTGRGQTSTKANNGKLMFGPAVGTKEKLVLTVSDDLNTFDDYRLIAIDKQGNTFTASRNWFSENGLRQNTFTFSSLELDTIDHFEFQDRPYEWVTFRNVSLKPGNKTTVKIETEGQKQNTASEHKENNEQTTANPDSRYIATLSNGVTVELAGMCEFPRDGKPWWQPDGSPINTTIPDFFENDSINIDSNRMGREILLYFTGYSDTVGIKSEIPQTQIQLFGRMIAKDNPSIQNAYKVAFDLPNNQETMDIRLGIAAAEWKTISTITVDTNSPDLWINRYMSDLIWNKPIESDGKTTIVVNHTYTNNNVQIVAICTDGRVLMSKTADQGNLKNTENLNVVFDERLSKIKEFQFKARPWEWVTFKNVSLKPGIKTAVATETEKDTPATQGIGKYTPEQIKEKDIEFFFARIGNPESGYHGFSGLWALTEKGKDADNDVVEQITKRASEIIRNSSETPFRRWICCYVISGIRDEAGISAIADALVHDENYTVRGVAACALGQFYTDEAVIFLKEAQLHESNKDVQEWIRRALCGEFRNNFQTNKADNTDKKWTAKMQEKLTAGYAKVKEAYDKQDWSAMKEKAAQLKVAMAEYKQAAAEKYQNQVKPELQKLMAELAELNAQLEQAARDSKNDVIVPAYEKLMQKWAQFKAEISANESTQEIISYEVNRNVSDFPEAEDFSTPESAYAAINRIGTKGDNAEWARVSVKRLAEIFNRSAQKYDVPADWQEVLKNAKILKVWVREDHAVVAAELLQKYSKKSIREPIDLRYLEKVGDQWLNIGNDQADTLSRAETLFLLRRLQSKNEGLKKVIRDEKYAQIVKNPDELRQAAESLFNNIRQADYDYFLTHKDLSKFPTMGYYQAHTDHGGLVNWICKTFKDNPIVSVELGQVFINQDQRPTVPYKLTLKDGKVLAGNLPFEYEPSGDENVPSYWEGIEGIDWHLNSQPFQNNKTVEISSDNEKPAAVAGSKLEFRIAPIKQVESSASVIVQCCMQLEKEGPDRIESSSPYRWFALKEGSVAANCVTGQYQGRDYVLLHTQNPYVMLASQGWGVEGVTSKNDQNGSPALLVTLDQKGTDLLWQITRDNINKPMAIVVDGQVIAAPTIMSKVSHEVMITGKFTEDEIRKLAASLCTGMPPVEPWQGNEPGFEPVVKKTIVTLPDEHQVEGLDLDQGAIIKLPNDFPPKDDSNKYIQWIAEHGIDVFCMGQGKNGLVGYDIIALPCEAQDFENATVQSVCSLPKDYKAGTISFMPADGILPATYIFRTREGGQGILKIPGFIENGKGVKIQYKLVKKEIVAASETTTEAKTLFDEAESIFQAAQKLPKDQREANFLEAMGLYRKVHEQYPNDAYYDENALMMIGLCYDWLGKLDDEIKAFEFAIEKYPNHFPAVHYYLGSAYKRAGQKDKAAAAFKKCMSLCQSHNGFPYTAAEVDLKHVEK